MEELSLFKITAIAFGLITIWLLSLTLYARRGPRERHVSLTLLGCSLVLLAIIYLALAGLLFLDTGYLYYANRGNVAASAPGDSWPLAFSVFVAVLPPVLLAVIGWLVLKNARVGPNNSFKPKPLRGSA